MKIRQCERNEDWERRDSLHGYYKFPPGVIEELKIEYTSELASADGAIYHCWVPRGLSENKKWELIEAFRIAAHRKGDPVGFTWDWEPFTEIKKSTYGESNTPCWEVIDRATGKKFGRFSDEYLAYTNRQDIEATLAKKEKSK